MNLANKLTLLRVILIPVFMVALLVDAIPYHNYIALAVFLIASFTDHLDGHIARKYNMITDFGKFMDPLADKLLVTAAMVIMTQTGQIPAWATMIVLAREFAVSGLRMVAATTGTVMAAGKSGKVKTASSMVCLSAMMVWPMWGSANEVGVIVNWVCVGIICLTTVYSGVEYFVKNGKVLAGKA